jgi:hypothetical protein
MAACAPLRACKKRGLRVVPASSADEREFAALRAPLPDSFLGRRG